MTLTLKYVKPYGYKSLICRINGTNSSEPLSIPYVEGPKFEYSPTKFELKKNFTFTCSGQILPAPVLITKFLFNNKLIAQVVNKEITVGKIDGLKVYNSTQAQSIVVEASKPENNGTYSCAFHFQMAYARVDEFTSINNWKTNGVSTLVAQIFAISISALFAFFLNSP